MDDNSLVINKIQDIQQPADERETDSGTYEKSPLKKLTALEVVISRTSMTRSGRTVRARCV